MRTTRVRLLSGVVLGMLGVEGPVAAQKQLPAAAPTTNTTGNKASPTLTPPKLNLPVPNVVPSGPSANAKDVEAAADTVCDNWDFEKGLACWTDASANKPSAFASQPTLGDNVVASRVMRTMEYASGGIGGDYWKKVPYPTGGVKKNVSLKKGRWASHLWIGTYERHPNDSTPHGSIQGDAPQGELRSKPFRVKNRYLSFLVGGGKSTNVGVALQVPSYLAAKVPPSVSFKRTNTNDGWVGFDRVKATGATAGVITMAYRKHGYPNDQHPLVANDCDGSSKTYAQSYLYSVDKLDGQAVGIATDRGFTDFIAPRFGTHASYRLRDESVDQLKVVKRAEQKKAQANGVRYDIGFKFFHPARFEFGETTLEEEDAWKAMAYWEARQISPLDGRYNALAADDKIPQSSHVGHGGRIESLVRGLAATNESQLRDCCGDTPFEEAAMLALKQNKTPAQFVASSTRGVFKNNLAAIQRVYDYAAPVYRLWNAMRGVNEPLRKRIDGVRDWDVNIDGVAHYGMLPDMLQDMANIGVTPAQLAPLFSSAEDYILMWERADAGAASARTTLPK